MISQLLPPLRRWAFLSNTNGTRFKSILGRVPFSFTTAVLFAVSFFGFNGRRSLGAEGKSVWVRELSGRRRTFSFIYRGTNHESMS